MTRIFRRPLAVVALALAAGPLSAQPPAPVPPPASPVQPLPAPAAPRDLVSYREVVKKVVPAVVSIEARAVDRVLGPGRRGVGEADDPAARRPDTNLGFGSGVVIDPAGVVVTNSHVVEGADSVEVEFQDGRKFVSKDIRRDAQTDLAVVKVAADKPLPFLELGDSDAAEVGDRVLAVGAPFGLTGSVTHGIVSGKSRRNLKLNQYEDFLQTDAAINPGNSGGPLVDLDGKVIGIASAIKTRSGGFQGVGLAISSNLVRDVSAQLLKGGVVRRGYLGVTIRAVDADAAARLGVEPGAGVVVSRVYDNSPAAKAGLAVGDVITTVAKAPVRDAGSLSRVVAKLQPGQTVEVAYVRGGKPAAALVGVEEQPGEYGTRPVPAAPSDPRPQPAVPAPTAGVYVTDLNPQAAADLGYPKAVRGVLIASVEKGGPAAEAGLARGLVVVKVDKAAVASAKEFADALAAADRERGALLHVLRPTGEVDFVVLRVQ